MVMAEYIEREALNARFEETDWYHIGSQGNLARGANSDIDTPLYKASDVYRVINETPAADVVEVDKVAEMLRLSFGDDCACNFNGNDEWLWEKCKYAETDCPYPKEDNGCWKEFVRAMCAKMDGKGEGE